MLRQELGNIVGAAVDNDPAGFGVVVLSDLLAGELHLLGVITVVVHRRGVVVGAGCWRIGNQVAKIGQKIYGADLGYFQALKAWAGGRARLVTAACLG